jgi:hypothetical protein
MRRRDLLRLLATSPLALLAEDLPSGDAVLDRYIEVTGGKEAYQKLNSEVATGAVTFVTQGVKGSVKVYRSKAGSRTVITLDGVGEMLEGIAPSLAWEKSAMMGARIKSGAERDAAVRASAMDRDHNWRAYYSAAKNLGVESVNGEDCFKIELTPKSGKPEFRYYSKATGLLAKVTMTLPNPMGEIPAESVISEYKVVQGLKIPTKTEMTAMGQKMLLTLDTVTINVPVPAADIAAPADVIALTKTAEAPKK